MKISLSGSIIVPCRPQDFSTVPHSVPLRLLFLPSLKLCLFLRSGKLGTVRYKMQKKNQKLVTENQDIKMLLLCIIVHYAQEVYKLEKFVRDFPTSLGKQQYTCLHLNKFESSKSWNIHMRTKGLLFKDISHTASREWKETNLKYCTLISCLTTLHTFLHVFSRIYLALQTNHINNNIILTYVPSTVCYFGS